MLRLKSCVGTDTCQITLLLNLSEECNIYLLVCFVELLPENFNELFIFVLALHGGEGDLFLQYRVVKTGRQRYVVQNTIRISIKKAIFVMKKMVTAAIHFRSEFHLCWCFENILIIVVNFEDEKFIFDISVLLKNNHDFDTIAWLQSSFQLYFFIWNLL